VGSSPPPAPPAVLCYVQRGSWTGSLIGVRGVIDDIEIKSAIDPVDVDLHVQQALERSALVPDGSDVPRRPRTASSR
jgi:hypothetical protein